MKFSASLVVLIALAGCHERDSAFERERTVLGPVPLKDRVAYIDSAQDQVVIVDLSEPSPRVQTVKIGRNALRAEPTPDQERLAVITRGEEAISAGQVDEDSALWLIDAANPTAGATRYPLESPFDRLVVAEDNSVAVAHFSSSGPDDTGFFRNPNELAIVDLTAPPSDENPVIKTVRSFGSAPHGILLSPPIAIPFATDPEPRTFAFVFAVGNLTIFDTTHPERDEISVRLDGTGSSVLPREMVFSPETATAYLRSDNARDILEIIISHEPPAEADPNDNDYRVLLAELGAGGGPADIAVYDDLSGRRMVLAATPTTGEVVLIDAETAQFTRVPVGDPIDRILLFPNGPDQTPRVALLASIAGRRSSVHLLILDDITDELVPARLDRIVMGQPILDVLPVPSRELAMIVHDDARTVLGLLDIAFGAVSPLEGVGRLDNYTFSADGSYLIGATDGVERVGFVELDNLHPTDLRLDDPAGRVLAMPSGVVYIDHGANFGLATIAPSPSADRAESIVLSGFMLSGLFDEEY